MVIHTYSYDYFELSHGQSTTGVDVCGLSLVFSPGRPFPTGSDVGSVVVFGDADLAPDAVSEEFSFGYPATHRLGRDAQELGNLVDRKQSRETRLPGGHVRPPALPIMMGGENRPSATFQWVPARPRVGAVKEDGRSPLLDVDCTLNSTSPGPLWPQKERGITTWPLGTESASWPTILLPGEEDS